MTFPVMIAIDDIQLMNQLMVAIERSGLGFKVCATAQTGMQALSLMAETQPLLLITDIRMPIIDGLSILKTARERHPSIDCILFSSYSEYECAKISSRHTHLDCLFKPLDYDALRVLLSQYAKTYQNDLQGARRCFGSHPETLSEDELASALHEYIIQHFDGNLRLSMIAEYVKDTSTHLIDIFKTHYDEDPLQFLFSLRILKATGLLKNHRELTIRQIAEAVGFKDYVDFSQQFLERTGKTPVEYRGSIK